MMNKEKWQKELSKLQLTEQQKKNINQTIIHSKRPKRQVNWTMVIAPVFVFTALFFLYLISNDDFVSPINQASKPVTDSYETEHLTELIRRGKHVAIISVLLIINGILATIVFFTMRRWQKPKILKLRKTVYSWRYVLIFIAPFIISAIGGILQMLELDIQWLKFSIFILIIIFQILLSFYFARNTSGTIYCPHCSHSFSKKEQIKMVWHFKMELHCPSCNEKLFYTKKYRQIIGVLTMQTTATLIFSPYFGLPLPLNILCVAIFILVICLVIMPLYLDLKKEEEFLF
ncbi:hypothetical protein H9635_10375 [Solibacillus sp. A46]|uniref:C2H2-type domain-containing protein n=1 Tax=Solibacillus faecavium TaxID=2762221 RepID=A0ABR8XZ12_9BACL|nr:TIGR04104 family putative zinc finger protein [Solibacillus faecavium]MBD8037152.1 hypothetical protein [Solibacillus faecavium]